MTNPTDINNPHRKIDAPYLQQVCAGGIAQVITGKMSPETLQAIGTAANAYAALKHVSDLEQRVQALEGQLIMLRSRGVSA